MYNFHKRMDGRVLVEGINIHLVNGKGSVVRHMHLLWRVDCFFKKIPNVIKIVRPTVM